MHKIWSLVASLSFRCFLFNSTLLKQHFQNTVLKLKQIELVNEYLNRCGRDLNVLLVIDELLGDNMKFRRKSVAFFPEFGFVIIEKSFN